MVSILLNKFFQLCYVSHDWVWFVFDRVVRREVSLAFGKEFIKNLRNLTHSFCFCLNCAYRYVLQYIPLKSYNYGSLNKNNNIIL